ncbi:MAG: hypothetical protein V4672_18630 [Verrucomicrobiota bacterium]
MKLKTLRAFKWGAAILGCLFVISFFVPHSPPTGHERPDSPNLVRKRMLEMKESVERFRREYDRFPVLGSSQTLDLELRSDGAFVAALLGRSEMLNPKNQPFYQPSLAKNSMNGLQDLSGGTSDDPQDLSVLDAFGERYYVLLGLDEDGRLLDPQSRRTDNPIYLKTAIAIYSSGPDRDPKTWEDNITSWE